jgi:hypothetical protein
MKTILHLCADTGSDSKPFKDAGYKVICVGKDIGVCVAKVLLKLFMNVINIKVKNA